MIGFLFNPLIIKFGFSVILPISAKTGYNKIKLLKKLLNVYNNYYLKIKTSDLNALIHRLEHRGSHIKYGIQKSSAPPAFEFFVGQTVQNNTNLKRYITNSIHKNFELKGVPIEVNLREK